VCGIISLFLPLFENMGIVTLVFKTRENFFPCFQNKGKLLPLFAKQGKLLPLFVKYISPFTITAPKTKLFKSPKMSIETYMFAKITLLTVI
jgi:hypothetical protein